MSLIIGYWTSNESSRELRRLFADLIAACTAGDLKVAYGQGCAVATCGKHTSLNVVRNEPNCETLNATLAAGGKHSSPDVWGRVSDNELLLGRDVFGRATIFWTRSDETIWFSSQLKPLLKILKRPSICVNGFYAYGCFSYVPAPDTPVAGVFAVPAAVEMRWRLPLGEPESFSIHEWREAEEQITDKQHAAHTLRHLLEESTASQLAGSAQKTIGVFLSGGLDSAVTAALLAQSGAKLRAYTLDFDATPNSEVPHAELVARSLRIPLIKVPVGARTMRRSLKSTAAYLDGVYGDGVTVPLAVMYERASQEVDVVFNGEGGDQLFAGWTNKPLIASAVYENFDTANGTRQITAEYMRTFHKFHGHESGVYANDLLQQLDTTRPFRSLSRALNPSYTKTLLHKLRRANLLLKGADNIQPRATNLGLAHSLEVRTLFCSRELADWTFSVSDELWLHESCEKYLLKLAVIDWLPAEIVWREKRGMGVPLTLWLKGPLRRWCQKQLGPRQLGREGFWEKTIAEQIASGEFSGQIQGRRIGEALWLMLMWRAWRESVFDVAATARSPHNQIIGSLSFPFIPKLKRA